MKDEIKEIREYIACPQFGDNHYGKWGALKLEQRIKIKQLLDYITNLQEENERLKDELKRLHNLLNSQAYKDLDSYKSRCEKAIEYIELWHYRNDYRVNSFTTGCKNDLLNILQGVGKDE